MKIKSGFMLREIAKQWVVVPLGERTIEFNAIITLSETGAFLWKLLQKEATEDELIELLVTEYAIDIETAAQDTKEYLNDLREKGLIEE